MLGAKLLSRIAIGREIIGYLVVMDRGSAGDAEFAVHRLRIMPIKLVLNADAQ